jgi:hypothetical protein
MLGELSRAQTIYVARPVRFNWCGPLPATWGDKELLKYEVLFNGVYAAERQRIDLVNRFLQDGSLSREFIAREGYHPVEIREVPIQAHKGFLGILQEDMEAFDQARQEAHAVFGQRPAPTTA